MGQKRERLWVTGDDGKPFHCIDTKGMVLRIALILLFWGGEGFCTYTGPKTAKGEGPRLGGSTSIIKCLLSSNLTFSIVFNVVKMEEEVFRPSRVFFSF
jgi:hypothetical protein